MKGTKMKRYKLLKDTPIAPKGEIFQEYKKNKDIFLYWLDKNGAEYSTEFRKATIFNFDEWFEEVKESQSFKCMTSGMVSVIRGCSGGIEEFYRSTGNCYPTDTPDETIIKEQKLIPQAMHRLKMAAKKAWFEFNGSDGPDWSDDKQNKWSIQHSHNNHTLMTIPTAFIQGLGQVYFPTQESVQTYIDNHLDDLKLLFGVE